MHFEIFTVPCATNDLFGFHCEVGHRYVVLDYLRGDWRHLQYEDNKKKMHPKE
jgi:hypothetical protein